MMYELFEGHLPFFSKSTAELMMMQMTEDPPEMERADVPPEVRDVIFRMMQKDPADRPQSAKEVLLTLLPHVRLDASQELRIKPSESGSFRLQTAPNRSPALPPSSGSGSPPPGLRQHRPPTPTLAADPLTLSTEELSATRSNKGVLIAVVGGVLLLAVAAVAFLTSNGGESGGDTTPVDVSASGVASSPEHPSDSEAGGDEDDRVEVAEAADDKSSDKKGKRPAGRSRKSPKKGSAASKSDRAKTLKLTY
jgi:serine/threonine-protein kinase